MSDLGHLDLVKDIALFAVGLLGGYYISLHFHKLQKSEGEKTEDRIVSALERNYDQALRNGVKGSNIIYTLRNIKEELEPLTDIVEIRKQLDLVLSKLDQQEGTGVSDPPIDLLLRYKALGDKWSDLVSAKLNLHVLDANGHITVDRLLFVHKSIFPGGFAWSGKYRNEHVFVIDNFGTTARIVDLANVESKIATVPPEAIERNLTKLFSYWNSSLPQIASLGTKEIIDEIAQFHHEFELIHPFLDGNGRIGRLIMEDQLAFLFGKTVTFRPNQEAYYRALRMLSLGEPALLRELIEEELDKFHVQKDLA